MQRDIGNEIIAAIVVVGVLAFALTFAIILSLSSGTTAASPQVTTQPAVLLDLSTTPESTVHISEVSQAAEPTFTLLALPGSLTATNTPAALTFAVTFTPTQEPTNTPTSSAELIHQPTPTWTSDAPPTPSNTSTNTATVIAGPSFTPTHTFTRRPTATLTPTPTRTLTPTLTSTLTATLTATPIVTSTLTATDTLDSTAVGLRVFCITPFGWQPYAVQSGDTLSSVARATGSTVFDLQAANCLNRTATIAAGDVIYVPKLPDESSQAAALDWGVSPAPVGELQPVGCTNPNAIISEPVTRSRLGSRFAVRGTAAGSGFSYYTLEVRSDFVTVYIPYLIGTQPVVNGELGVIDRGNVLPPGVYWIRLSVFNQVGTSSSAARCAVPVYFE